MSHVCHAMCHSTPVVIVTLYMMSHTAAVPVCHGHHDDHLCGVMLSELQEGVSNLSWNSVRHAGNHPSVISHWLASSAIEAAGPYAMVVSWGSRIMEFAPIPLDR